MRYSGRATARGEQNTCSTGVLRQSHNRQESGVRPLAWSAISLTATRPRGSIPAYFQDFGGVRARHCEDPAE
jgi:hypothetical protein